MLSEGGDIVCCVKGGFGAFSVVGSRQVGLGTCLVFEDGRRARLDFVFLLSRPGVLQVWVAPGLVIKMSLPPGQWLCCYPFLAM